MKFMVIGIISIALSACSSSDSNNSPLIGTWLTQSCNQVTDALDVPINSWAIGKYEFTNDGLIQFDPVHYDDSQCLIKSQQPLTTNTLTPPSYLDTGNVTLQEGIQGHTITITFPIPDDTFTIDSFYTINDGILCFSDALTFGPLKFGFATSGSDAINFNDCLVKQ